MIKHGMSSGNDDIDEFKYKIVHVKQVITPL